MADKKIVVEYGSEKVTLSRLYPFGETVTMGDKEVSQMTVNESYGEDDEIVAKGEAQGKLGGYVQIAVSTGITYEEAKMLASKDSKKLVEVLQGF